MLNRIEKHTVPREQSPMRLSDYCRNQFTSIPSRKGMKKAIDKGWVYINNELASTHSMIHEKDEIELRIPAKEFSRAVYELNLKLYFEDDEIAIIEKPAGMLSSGNNLQNIERALPFNLKPSSNTSALPYPKVAHRLDYPTSGIMIIAKTPIALTQLKNAFAVGEIKKTYLAITPGNMPDSGEINSPIDGKFAQTRYQTIYREPAFNYEFLNLLKVKIGTGRTHQIRKHLSGIGHPILGDQTYGNALVKMKKKGLFLHAFEIELIHPVSNELMVFTSTIPKKFLKVLPNYASN